MRRFALAIGILLASAAAALAQNPVVPTPPTSPCDNSNRVANTAWVTICAPAGSGGGGPAITALTGDVTATGPGSVAATLATVNPNVGTWGSATQVPQFTVNGKGLVTGVGNVAVALSGAYPGITGVGTLTSGATGAGFTMNFGASSLSGLVPLANGGTNASLAPSNGGIFYSTGSAAAILPGTPAPAQCLLSGANAAPSWGACSSSAAVSTVSSPDGSLAVSPTTGAVGVTLNVSNSNTWTAVQTFANSDMRLLGSSTGGTTFTSDNASATNFTMHVPAANSTLADIASTQTFTNKTWNGVPITGSFIANNTVANANLAQMPANTIKCNATGSTANATDCTPLQVSSVLSRPCLNIINYGGAGNNSTDNATPLANALAALSGTGGCIEFPAGKFRFNTAVSYSIPAGIFSVTIKGASKDATILTWPSASAGLIFNYAAYTSSVHISDLSLTTGLAGGGSAITLSLNVAGAAANSANSDIKNITIRGDDGYALTDYWSTGIDVENVSNVNFTNFEIFGSSTPNGNGISLIGLPSAMSYGVAYNISHGTFVNNQTGLIYGSYIQGVTVSQSNFTDGTNGIVVPGSQTGTLAQLFVVNSQFGQTQVGIQTNTTVEHVAISNNLFIASGAGYGISLNNSYQFAVTGNTFGSNATTGSALAVTGTGAGTISGNTIFGFNTGIWLTANVGYITVSGNQLLDPFTPNSTPLLNSSNATTNIIVNNPGFNPVGVTAATSTGATGSTIRAGSSPETHYVKQSATFNAAITKGGQAICTVPSANVPCVIQLGPNETYSVAWVTTQPTYTKDVH